mmetsp:Transcript_28432/g.70413  ORF Transcript_28432/g.70413 Transcript_28432/m.70413 type:complete len:246 (-) Transcript_28432:345-1082(-)
MPHMLGISASWFLFCAVCSLQVTVTVLAPGSPALETWASASDSANHLGEHGLEQTRWQQEDVEGERQTETESNLLDDPHDSDCSHDGREGGRVLLQERRLDVLEAERRSLRAAREQLGTPQGTMHGTRETLQHPRQRHSDGLAAEAHNDLRPLLVFWLHGTLQNRTGDMIRRVAEYVADRAPECDRRSELEPQRRYHGEADAVDATCCLDDLFGVHALHDRPELLGRMERRVRCLLRGLLLPGRL